METQKDSKGDGMLSEEAALYRQLREVFEKIPREIPLFLFTQEGKDDVYSRAIRETVRAFRALTDKIRFQEFPLDHEQAKKWEVDSAPTLLIDPKRYRIRWLGAPMGEEGRTFLETLILVGMGKSHLSDSSVKMVRRMEGERKIKVFVSATCPYCPQQAVNAVKAVVERPETLSLDIVDIQVRPELAEAYGAHSVPMAFANDILIGHGAQPEEVFFSSLEKMEPQTLFIPEIDAEWIETDLVIVGGGPAGLTAGIYAERSGLKSVIIEKGALGGQVATTPVVENYPGFTQVGERPWWTSW